MSSQPQISDAERAVLETVDILRRHPDGQLDPYQVLAKDARTLKKFDDSIQVLKILVWISLALFLLSIASGVPIFLSITFLTLIGIGVALTVQTTRRSRLRGDAHVLLRKKLTEQAAQAEAAQHQYEHDLRAYHAAIRATLGAWQQQHPLPQPQPYGVSHQGAEAWVRDWLEAMGAEGSTVTQQSGDGGIDVASHYYIAQVKHYTGSVGIGEVREMVGAVAADQQKRIGLFFTSGQYPASALKLAEQVNLALFQYDVTTATVTPVNDLAERLQTRGFHPQWWRTT